MKKKVFSLMMTLLLAFMGVAKADVVTIGDPTSTTTNSYLPGYSLYEYSISQQIYTADEIGTGGTINTLTMWLKNNSSYARNLNVYMKEVNNATFASNSDWVSMTASDMVASFTMANGISSPVETAITLTTPFAYSGNGNLVICVQDVTGSWSSGLGGVEMNAEGNQAIYAYRDGTVYDPTTPGVNGSLVAKKNVVALDITPGGGGGGGGYQTGLHTLVYNGAEEVIDVLPIERPNGAWMEPYHFQLYNDGTADIEVVYIDFLHNNGYFSMDEETTSYPFEVARLDTVDLYFTTNPDHTGTEIIQTQMAVNTTERSTHLFDIVAAPYQPYCPDVWELAYQLNNGNVIGADFTWREFMSNIMDPQAPADYQLHQNYDLPDYEENIPDGYDAVMKFSVDKVMRLNAKVVDGYADGKVALYTQDFYGQNGPMADNNYVARPTSGGGIAPASGEITVYDGEPQTTNGYVPVYGFYADSYLKMEMVYPAVALSHMAGTDINSMKFYASQANVSWGNANFQIFLSEVADATISAFTGTGTTVYTGALSIVDGEMLVEFTTPYHYNGGNLLVGIYNTAIGSYVTSSWYGQTITGASVQGYNYNSLSSVSPTQRDFLPKTTFSFGASRSRDLVEIGDGTTNSYAAPYNSLWGYSYVEQIYTAAEIGTAGTINSISFNMYSTASQTNQIDVFMKNVTRSSFESNTDYEPVAASDMVFSGTVTFNEGWTTITLDTPFEYDGTSNLMIGMHEYTPGYQTRYFYYTSTPNSVISFHSDGVDPNPYNLASYTGNVAARQERANIQIDITPGQGGGGTVEPAFHEWSAGPEITELAIVPGTYYLVASSTDQDFEVEINVNEIDCDAFEKAQVVYPEDNAEGIDPSSVTLQWRLNPDCTEYRLVFSSTYHPDDENPEEFPYTIITEWSSNLEEQYTVTDLFHNTNYFWRIDQRVNGGTEAGGCTIEGDIWGFTTKFRIPNPLTVEPDRIYEGETVTLTWTPIQDRTYRQYYIYQDGVKIHETAQTPDPSVNYTWEVPASYLTYNYPGTYVFNVTAVYDEGESDFSNDVTVTVGGYSATNGINGYVFEQDGVTPIVGATVEIQGTDALFNQPQTYTATTNADGYYEVQVYEGTYTSAVASMPGYQNAEPYQNEPPFYVGHNEHHDDMNFMLDELFLMPESVCAQTVYVQGVEGDSLVQVYWEFPNFDMYSGTAFEAQIGEGTSTTTYMPYHTLWNYSLSTALYRADELEAAGVNRAPMTSLSWYCASTSTTNPQQGITIWMANVSYDVVSATSPLTAGMTKVYTGGTTPVVGWNEFVFNQESFAWDGSSNVLIVVQRLNGSWNGTTSWQAHNAGFNAMSYEYDDYEVYNAESMTYSMSVGTTRPNIIMRGGGRNDESANDMTRYLHHFNIYRTYCYNDGPYTHDLENDPDHYTEFLATAWVPDTSYFDVSWPTVAPGVYKFGVSAVYFGNHNQERDGYYVDHEPRESEIMWQSCPTYCIDKDMQTDITVNVLCNSADSPAGAIVSFTNLNEDEQAAHPMPSITMPDVDEQPVPVIPFRKGDYKVTVYLPGYELIVDYVSIWGHEDLRYVLTEIYQYSVKNIYVSRTGWAMWEPETWEDYPIPEGAGSSIIDFETANFNQYAFDNTVSSYPWTVVQEGQDGGYCMKSTNSGIANSVSAIEASVNYPAAGLVTFDLWSRGEGSSDNYDWDKSRFYIDGTRVMDYGAHSGWETFTADVAAGQHTFRWEYKKDASVNPQGDCFLVDNINFNIGGHRNDRHLEGYKVMCTSIDGEQIFNHNNIVYQPFCQLNTEDLIEDSTYVVQVCAIYSTGQSPWSRQEWVYEPCDHWGPVDEVTATTQSQGNHIEWVFEHGYNPYPLYPGGGGGGQGETSFSEDFENGIPEGWTTIDANNDGFDWMAASAYPHEDLTGMGHNNSNDFVVSESYDNNPPYTPITPDNYLVTPLVSIVNGSTFSFWATDGNDAYGAEHFGVAISTTGNTDAADFTTIAEWTLLSKGGAKHGGARQINDGIWYQKTVDLSAYAGQDVYIAIRHFNCNDQWIICVDDVELTSGRSADVASAIEGYKNDVVYRQYADNGVAFNFFALDNTDFRAYLLYSLSKDDRFEVEDQSDYGQFVINPATEMTHFFGEFEMFYQNAAYNFSLMSKAEIADNMEAWKAAVDPHHFASIFMDMVLFGYRDDPNPTFDSATPFCTEEGLNTLESSYTGAEAVEDADYGCVISPRNPSWYTMRISHGGQFVIHIEGHDPNTGVTRDVDFIMWGPFTQDEMENGTPSQLFTSNKIIDCNFSASYTEDCYLGYPADQHQHNANHGTVNYHVPEAGEYYVLLITNYSNQPSTITFTKPEGSGEGETDCEYVAPSDIIGFLITLDGEYLAFVGPDDREYDHIGEYGDHEYCVRPIYPGLAHMPDSNFYFSMGCPVCAFTTDELVCEAGDAIYGEATEGGEAHLWWGTDPGQGPGILLQDDFEGYEAFSVDPVDGAWIFFDGDGGETYGFSGLDFPNSGYVGAGIIMNTSEVPALADNYAAHSGDQYLAFFNSAPSTIISGQTTNDWMISAELENPTSLSFFARELTTNYGAEVMRVLYSTTTNDPAAFQLIEQVNVNTTEWTEYSYDLPAGTKYVAINCVSNDVFALFIDDVTIMTGTRTRDANLLGYNIYRSEDNETYSLVAFVEANDDNWYEYFETPAAGTYFYQVRALYDNGCESDPAVSGIDPEVDYVIILISEESTGIEENEAKVNLFPNPTKGNVTIQAESMNRITVVTVLGQVVFDTELDGNEYVLNMAQFNAGMYMVRVYTENGVAVKRVTVMQ